MALLKDELQLESPDELLSELGRNLVEGSLTDPAILSQTTGPVQQILPDANVIKIGGQSLIDRGRRAVFPLIEEIVDNLRSVGIATIAGSGNGGEVGRLTAPACISSVVSVGATDDGDQVATFSNSASFLDLLAPGVSITSAIPPALPEGPYTCAGGPGYATCDGTSMATPHVAGAWAVFKQQFPSASVDGVLATFTASGVQVFDPRNGLIKPRLDLGAALGLCSPPAEGDWIVSQSCTFHGTAAAPRNVIVQSPATLTVAAGALLDIDFTRFHLRVRDGGRVIVRAGARID